MGKMPNWTKEDLEYLNESWGTRSITAIARRLGRSVDAVRLKAQRIGLKRHIHSGERITFSQFCDAIGKDYDWTKERYERLGLPIHYQASINKRYPMVDIDEFWEWAEAHKDDVDFSRIPKGTFGKEPAWVKEARHASFLKRRKKTPWTKSEDERLIQLLKSYRYTYPELARILNRTEGAVKRRVSTLGTKYRPLRRDVKMWTDEEVDTMLELRAKGYGWDTVGEKLGRSAQSRRGKYDLLVNPHYNKQYRFEHNTDGVEYFQGGQCKHYTKVNGCEMECTNCDECVHFLRRDPDDHDTGWLSTRDKTAEQLLKERKEAKQP